MGRSTTRVCRRQRRSSLHYLVTPAMSVAAHIFRGLSYALVPAVVVSGFVFLTTCHWFVVAFRLPKGMRFGSAAWEYVIATERWAYLRRPGISNRFSCLWVIPSLKTFLVSGFASGASFLLAFAFNGFVNPAPL